MSARDPQLRQQEIVGKPPRIAPAPAAPDELTALMATPEGRYGDRPKPQLMLMMLHHPAAARSFRPIRLEDRRLSVRDQELVILRTGWLCQVPFIWGEHVRLAKANGFTAQEIERVTLGSQADGWCEHERALLRATEELRAEAMISDATWATLSATLDTAQMVELPILIGQYQALGYLQNALRVPLWPGNDGLAAR